LMLRLVINQQPEASLAVYQEAQARGVNSPYLSWGLGMAHQVLGREGDARAAFANLRAAGGPYAPHGRLYDARTDVLFGRWQLASQKLGADIAILRDQGNRSFEVTSRLLLARLRILNGERSGAVEDLKNLLREDEGAIRSNELRQIGTMLAHANALPEAKAVLIKLQSSTPSDTQSSAFVRSCASNLQGEIALAEGRDEAAATMFMVARAAYPQHASAIGLARVHERRRQWRAAASAWKDVMAGSGDILRFGFPADVPLARLQRARALTRAGFKEEAKGEFQSLREFWNAADRRVIDSLTSRIDEPPAPALRNEDRSQGET
jgi:hypothetical protein